MLELDTDVNGERVKKLADEIEAKARRLKVNKELLHQIDEVYNLKLSYVKDYKEQ